jgi:hypothetical protein
MICYMYPIVLPLCTVIVLSLFYFATDMAPKKKAAMTDRVTAKKAKAYIYGVKKNKEIGGSQKDEHIS